MFQTPYEVAQSQLRGLRLLTVDETREVAALFPLFDREGHSKLILLDFAKEMKKRAEFFEPNCLYLVAEFPMEIRLKRAIYSRPIARFSMASQLVPDQIAGLWFLDPWERIPRHPGLPEEVRESFKLANLGIKPYREERLEDLFFTRDLRKVTGGAARKGLLGRRRLEMLELLKVMASS